MTDCLFCKLSNMKENHVWENDLFYSMLDANPVSPGYVLVIPKRHAVDLLDMNDEEWLSLKDAIKQTLDVVKKTDLKKEYEKIIKRNISERSRKLCESMIKDKNINKHPDAYNIGVNNGEAAGRTIHHVHVHIIPRFNNDTEHPAGGIRHILGHKDLE